MPLFKKESLEVLRQKVDLVEVLSSYIDLKRSGTTYKGLCPFHDEKTPSFVLQKGDNHYHCFGCGAHGDAIQFLMSHQRMSFSDAVEYLANRFHVRLETTEKSEEEKGPSKNLLKLALSEASDFFQFSLLHTAEGEAALRYLHDRGIDLDFIRLFQLGFAPKAPGMLRTFLHAKKLSDEVQFTAGLLSEGYNGQLRDFFSDRIMFPIHNATGEVIAFSGRKYKEETFGGKYINTPETPLFKKSKVLFGLNYSRKRIAKERHVIVVEGQMDALRLIRAGFNFTVAGQGTAFGEGHVKELLNLGIHKVYLALDADKAGQEATLKIGQLFQKEGVEVSVISIPFGKDPDAFVKEQGAESFIKLMEESVEFLEFLVHHLSIGLNLDSPADKNQLIQQVVKHIRGWEQPIMVHEALKKVSHKLHIPEEMVGVGREVTPNVYLKKSASVGVEIIDPDKILESDLLRWLILEGQGNKLFIDLVFQNVKEEDFHVPLCRQIFVSYKEKIEKEGLCDLMSLVIAVADPEAQSLLSQLTHKKVNRDRAEAQLTETLQKILDRNWMEQRETLRRQIQAGNLGYEATLKLSQEFNELARHRPSVVKSGKS